MMQTLNWVYRIWMGERALELCGSSVGQMATSFKKVNGSAGSHKMRGIFRIAEEVSSQVIS
jgi:hypothetical protein